MGRCGQIEGRTDKLTDRQTERQIDKKDRYCETDRQTEVKRKTKEWPSQRMLMCGFCIDVMTL